MILLVPLAAPPDDLLDDTRRKTSLDV